MPQQIRTLSLTGVNCYLADVGDGFILIDTGFLSQRAALERALAKAGCRPGNLKLVILTHGDSDHVDNAAFLQRKYGARIAIHHADAGIVEPGGDMSVGRKAKPDHMAWFFRVMIALFATRVSKPESFTPDVRLQDGQSLCEFGLGARVVSLPGHSPGSIGILTGDGDLYCGDLLASFFGPALHPYIDDLAAATASVERLKALNARTVFPGHGKPFSLARFLKGYRQPRR